MREAARKKAEDDAAAAKKKADDDAAAAKKKADDDAAAAKKKADDDAEAKQRPAASANPGEASQRRRTSVDCRLMAASDDVDGLANADDFGSSSSVIITVPGKGRLTLKTPVGKTATLAEPCRNSFARRLR